MSGTVCWGENRTWVTADSSVEMTPLWVAASGCFERVCDLQSRRPMRAHSTWTEKAGSREAGVELGEAISAQVSDVKVVIVYATIHHELEQLLAGLASRLPPGTTISGCSSHGVTLRNFFREDGFLAGAIGLGDDALLAASAVANEINVDTVEKARQLARTVRDRIGHAPKALLLYYDPLSRVDVPRLIAGVNEVLPETLVVGGAAGQPWGPMVRTYQFDGTTVATGACVALGLDGPFGLVCGRSSGASPAGIRMKVTRAEGNHVLELDGRPALEVWLEMVGRETCTNNVDDSAAWAIGLREKDSGSIDGEEPWAIMAAFGFDEARKSVILQASVPADVEVMFHHRTVEAVSKGTLELAERLRRQLGGASAIAALGFECAARAGPFLGVEETRRENCQLQEALAPDAAWLGLMAWGEVAPSPVKVAFCNYTFPVLLLTDAGVKH